MDAAAILGSLRLSACGLPAASLLLGSAQGPPGAKHEEVATVTESTRARMVRIAPFLTPASTTRLISGDF